MRALPLLCCLLLASAPACAQTIYKWKDANGVTQYSEKPPANQKAEQRRITARDPAVAAATPAPAAAESPQCVQTRKNLAALNGQGQVMYDTNGDGKPDTALTPEQREAQKGVAEAGIKTYCPQGA